MATERQVAANRRNARHSTGPRSAAGKARVAGNAQRHGLSASLPDDPDQDRRIEDLARLIVGDNPLPGALHYARIAASATLKIVWIRKIRAGLMEPAAQQNAHFPRNRLWELQYGSRSKVTVRDVQAIVRELDYGLAILQNPTASRRQGPKTRLSGGQNNEQPRSVEPRLIAEALKRDRYERREVSRRKRAVRSLDRLRALDAAN